MSDPRLEQRKSPRIVRTVPLSISDVDQSVDGQSAVINAHGALILSPVFFIPGTAVSLTNRHTEAAIDGTVVWGESDPPLGFKLGVEFAHAAPEFWGEDYTP